MSKVNGTLAYASVGQARIQPSPRDGTIFRTAASEEAPVSATLPAPVTTSGLLSAALAATAAAPVVATRTTVLPKVEIDAAGGAPILVPQDKPRYRELGRLGEGGLGEVTLAHDEDIGRSVAIKRLHVNDDRGQLLRFVDEVRLTGELDHPNIVPLHDVGCDDSGRLYFVMKRMEGETLETIIERLRDGDRTTHRRYPIEVRVDIFLGVLRAIQFAHARRIIHRDIKPSNIMVGRYGEVAVMDWGIAKRLDDPISDAIDASAPARDEVPAGALVRRDFHTRVGTLLGTPAYMSPEQARGDVHLLDERSDVFSLTVVLYELLTLRHYLEDVDTLPALLDGVRTRIAQKAMMVEHRHGRPISVEMSNFLDRGMAKLPEERFANVSEMLEALHRIQNGTFPVTCPVTLTKRGVLGFARIIDRHPLAIMLGLTGGVLGTIGGAAALVARLVW